MVRQYTTYKGLFNAALQFTQGSRDSSVGIATGYDLDDGGIGLLVPVGSSIFSSPCCPDRLWGHPTSYPMSARGKAVGT
jgi:hypothetical protein